MAATENRLSRGEDSGLKSGKEGYTRKGGKQSGPQTNLQISSLAIQLPAVKPHILLTLTL